VFLTVAVNRGKFLNAVKNQYSIAVHLNTPPANDPFIRNLMRSSDANEYRTNLLTRFPWSAECFVKS